jgi:hypothetical protein
MQKMVDGVKVLGASDLKAAYEGSYYTILGAGGEISEWTNGYEGLLKEAEIGQPVEWFRTTGESLNRFAEAGGDYAIADRDQFDADLPVLLFPLDGLNVGRLAMFKLQYEDRWFDDIVQNMRRA